MEPVSGNGLSPVSIDRRVPEETPRRSSFRRAQSLAKITLDALLFSKSNGCQHYSRNAKLVAPCCGKMYFCRYCHDEIENHELNRFAVASVECALCGCTQPVAECCEQCGERFAKYYCSVCRLYDNDENKRIYHCAGCGICRVGDAKQFRHCANCNMCVPKSAAHFCRENSYNDVCAICLTDMRFSQNPAFTLQCSHALHATCFEAAVLATGRVECPICKHPASGDVQAVDACEGSDVAHCGSSISV